MFRSRVFDAASSAQTIADTYPAIRVAVELLGDGHSCASADRDDLIGWIVDLRGNGGGNMWPMLAGVGPVLGEGVVGSSSIRPEWKTFGSTATEPRGTMASWCSMSTRLIDYDASGREWLCSRTTALPVRRSDGHCFHSTPGSPIVRHRDLWPLHCEWRLRHE